MTTLQIIALSAIGAGIIAAIIFFIAFIVEISKKDREENEVKEIYNFPTATENNEAEVVEIDINEMLARLEENAANEKVEEPIQEEVAVESQEEVNAEPEVTAEFIEEEPEVQVEEAQAEEEVVTTAEEPVIEEVQVEEAQAEEEVVAPVVEEVKEEEPKTTVVIKKIKVCKFSSASI